MLFPVIFCFLGVWPEMYRCVRRNIMLGRYGLKTYVTPSESWDCSQRKKGEIIEERKLDNEIEDSRESLIAYRTISCAYLLFTSLINAVVTLVYCICNTRILTYKVFADTADCACEYVSVHLRIQCTSSLKKASKSHQTQQILILNAFVCLGKGTDPDFGCVYLIILSVSHRCTKVLLLECSEYW